MSMFFFQPHHFVLVYLDTLANAICYNFQDDEHSISFNKLTSFIWLENLNSDEIEFQPLFEILKNINKIKFLMKDKTKYNK